MSEPVSAKDERQRRSVWTREVRSRLSSLRLSPTRENEIVDELSQHLDDHYRELIAGGASPEDAQRLALADFRSGNVLARQLAALRQAHVTPPATPGASTGQALADVWQDVRYAARSLAKQPGFAVVAVLTLAIGIGATTAIFSVVYGVMLKPLPFHEPERLVDVSHRGWNHGPATYFTYLDNQRAFEAIGVWETNEVSVTGRGDPERLDVITVSDATLPILRVQPILGRLFNARDDTPGSPLCVILTYGYWQQRFGGDQSVVGQSLQVDGTPVEIIGVLPRSFRFLRANPSLVLPQRLDRADADHIEFDFQVLARLKPGVTVSQANDDVARMIPLLPRMFERLKMQPNVAPLADYVIGDVGRILWILLAAVGVVLLIACANVANLFLIRAETRQQELSMRAALGASRSRLARTLLTECVLLASVGGLLGVGLAGGALALLRAAAPAELPRLEEIGIDLTVLSFTLAISVLSGVMFGLVAVLRFGAPSIAALKEGGRSTSDAPGRHRTRNTLAVAQVALALILMIVSGLMIRTFVAMRNVDPGFTRPEEVQTFQLAIPETLVTDDVRMARIYHAIAERVSQVPGVASVGISSSITMDGEDNGNVLYVEEAPFAGEALPPLRRFKAFAPGYFETIGNRLVAGRSITWTEIFERRPVIVLSEVLAREYWGDPAKAIGKRVRGGQREAWCEIVGVVADARDDGLNHPPTDIVYWPLLNESYERRAFSFVVRSTRVGSPGFMREIRQAVWEVDPDLPLATVQTLEEIEARSMARTSFAMVMLGIAATAAVLLGVVGIYGVIAYVAKQRVREIGIRMALGAQIADVRAMFLSHGLWLTTAGVVLGIAVALLLTRVMSTLLFGVSPMDPVTYAGVSVTLGLVVLLATYLPARRAAQVDPVVALRADG